MYDESEDSWEEQPQTPSPEQDASGQESETAFTQEEVLTVPADQEKSGSAKSAGKTKKGIPRWQWGVLAGFGVVAIGGGAAFALLGGHPEPQAVPAGFNPITRPSNTESGMDAATQTTGYASGTASGGSVPVTGAAPANGFATLNALSGATPNPPANTASSASSASISAKTASTPVFGAIPVASSASPASSPATVTLLNAQIAHSKTEIARLQKELQMEKRVATEQGAPVPPPRVITRTIVRYVHVPVASPPTTHVPDATPVPGATPSQHPERVRHSSVHLNGWRIVGGDAHTAMLAGPGGQVRPVRTGDVLPGGELVQQVTLGEVVTSDGVIR